MKSTKRAISDIYSLFYFSTFVVCLINALRVYSLWEFYSKIGYYLELLSVGLTILLIPLFFSKYKGKETILFVFILFFILFVGINSERVGFLWISFALVAGAKGIPFRNIVKVHFFVCLCFCLLNMVGYEIGALKQANYFNDSIREGLSGEWTERLDFGYGWATDFANHVFFIILDLWILIRGKLNLWGYLALLSVIFFIIYFTDSRLAAMSLFLLVVFSFYLCMVENRKFHMGKITMWSHFLSVPTLAFLSIWATASYDSSNFFWVAADFILSGRLHLGFDTMTEYGISWFGQPVEMHGALDAGGMNDYNFVDSSYVQFLIRYGVIFICFLVLSFMKLSINAAKRNDIVLVLAITIAGLTGVAAQFLFDFRFCVLILALMSSHKSDKSLIL